MAKNQNYDCGTADGNLAILKSFIKGFRLNATNYDGRTALHEACQNEHLKSNFILNLLSIYFSMSALVHKEKNKSQERTVAIYFHCCHIK